MTVRQELHQLRPAARLQNPDVRVRDGGLVEGSPAQGERLLIVRAERLIDDGAVVREADLVALGLVLPTNGDQLLDDLERPLLPFELVALVLDPLDEEVLDVGHHVGEGEGDVVVLPKGDPGQTRDRGAAAGSPVQLEGDLVPDAGHAAGQVRVAGEQGPAGRRAARADRPVVRAARRRRQTDLVADAPDLLGQPQPVAVEALTGAKHDGIALRIGRVDLRGALLAQLADQVGAQQLPLPIGREPEREELAARQHVRRAPRLEVEAEKLELGRQRRGAPGRLVEAGAVRIEERSQVGAELRLLSQREPAQTKRPHQAVGRQSHPPRDLGDPAGADPALDVDLPESVLAVAEALPEPEVGGGLGPDRRHPPAVAGDLDPVIEPADLELARDTGQRAAEQLPPEAGRRRAEERSADPHSLGAATEQAG